MRNSVTGLLSIEFLGRVIGTITRYGLVVLIGRELGAAALGSFAFALTILHLGSAVTRIGLDSAVQKFIPSIEDPYRLTGTVLVCLTTPFITGVVVLALGYGLSHLIRSTATSLGGPVLWVILLTLPIYGPFIVAGAATQAYKETKYAVLSRDMGQKGGALLFGAIAIAAGYGITGVAVGYIVSVGTGLAIALVFLSRLGTFDNIRRARTDIRSIMEYAVPMVGVAVATPLVQWSDILLLGLLAPAADVGAYNAASRTAILLSSILVIVNSIFPPLAAEYYVAGDFEELEKLYQRLTKWIVLFTLFGASGVVIFRLQIISLFGFEFRYATTALIILVGGQVINASVGPAGYLLSMAGRERLEFLNTVGAALLNIALNIYLIVKFGIVGAAIATTITFTVLNIIRLVQIRVFLSIRPYSQEIWRISVPLVAGVSLLHLGSNMVQSSFVGLILATTVATAILLLLSFRFTYTENDQKLLRPL